MFDQHQISRSNHRNIQTEFKEYWELQYPHDPDKNHICECKRCFGIDHDNTIGLQDAVAFKLRQYLNKFSSCEAFDTGLDMKLKGSQFTRADMEYAKRLTTYAANDCDAIYQLILKSNLINDYYGYYDLLLDDIDQIDTMIIEEQRTTEQEQRTAPDVTYTNTTRTTKCGNPLSKEERVKIHNQSRSRHQRIKAYEREFIICNIDKRFPIHMVKNILKDHGIPITRIHPTQSKRTQETILFVGLKRPISTYKHNEVEHLFNREHYRRIFSNKSNNRSKTRTNHRQHTPRYNRQEHRRR